MKHSPGDVVKEVPPPPAQGELAPPRTRFDLLYEDLSHESLEVRTYSTTIDKPPESER
jgi:hypothetical protein